MVKPTPDTTKTDVLQAQISVSVSQARDLVSSWLPALPAQSSTATPELAGSEADDSTVFRALPPRLGLGAAVPNHFYDEDSKLRRDISSTDLLRRKMMGSKRQTAQTLDKSSSARPSRPHQQNRKGRDGSESEEETGRSALGKSKRQKTKESKIEQDANETSAQPGMSYASEPDRIVESVGGIAVTEVNGNETALDTPKSQPPADTEGGQNIGKKKRKKKKKLPQDKP